MTWRSSAKLGKVGLFIRERGVVQNHLPFSTNFLGSSARKAGVMLLEQELCWVWSGRGGPTEQVGLGDVSAALSALPVPQQHWKCSCCSHSWLTLTFLLLWLFVTVHYYDTQKQPRSVITYYVEIPILVYQKLTGVIRGIAGPRLTSFRWNLGEMPQERNRCLYQLAWGKLGFVRCCLT